MATSSSSSSESEEPVDCSSFLHLFNVSYLSDVHFDPEDEYWQPCDTHPCPNRYTNAHLPLLRRPQSFAFEHIAVYQEDPNYDGSGPPIWLSIPLPDSPVEQSASLSDPFLDFISNSPEEQLESFNISPVLPDSPETYVLENSFTDKQTDFIIVTSIMSDIKSDTIPILKAASGYNEWASSMKGYLTFLCSWYACVTDKPIAASDNHNEVDKWEDANARAQGMLFMQTDRSMHHHLEKTNGEMLSAKEM